MFIIMYDVTKKSSFDEGLNYEKRIKSSKKNAPIIWIGNKCDLLSSDQLKLLKEKGPSEYFSSEKVDSNGQGNTADKVNIFEKSAEASESVSKDKDRKSYVVSAKTDNSSVFKKIVHELVKSSETRKSFEEKCRMFEINA